MTAKVAPCRACGQPKDVILKGVRYCTPCREKQPAVRKRLAKERALSRNTPCAGCGGPKDRGVRGARYCASCQEGMLPVWAQQEKERNRRRREQSREARGIKQRVPRIREDGRVWCGRCTEYLAPNRFARSSTQKCGFAAYCRHCTSAYNLQRRLKHEFGMSYDDYLRILDVQGGRCAICRNRPKTANLAVDHDHATGEIRGLLCKRCNRDLLGAARDSIEMLERAVCYLESPPARTGVAVCIHEEFVEPKRLSRTPAYKPARFARA